MRWIALFALLCTGNALAQTCSLPVADPLPHDAAVLEWPAVTQWDDGSAMTSGVLGTLTYIVYERVDGENVRRCVTRELTAGFANLSEGEHEWCVAVMTPEGAPAWQASRCSPYASKGVTATPAPDPDPTPTRRVPAGPASLSVR